MPCALAALPALQARTDHIEVSLSLLRAQKGESGYFVLGDGRYGTFRLDNGACREKRGKNGFLPVVGGSADRCIFDGLGEDPTSFHVVFPGGSDRGRGPSREVKLSELLESTTNAIVMFYRPG